MKNTDKTKVLSEKNQEEKNTVVPERSNESEKNAKTPQDKKSLFAKLVSDEYKEVFEEIMSEKLAKSKEENELLRKKLAEANEVLDLLSDRYNASDAASLKKAVKTDDSLFAPEASKRGMDVDSYRYMRNLERENARAKAEIERSKLESEIAQKMKAWYAASGDISAQYPDFNLADEINNPKFVELMRSGIDMKTAYEVLHHDDIIEHIRKENAEKAKKEAAMELEARNNRPVENGLSSQSSAVFKKDVSLLTPEERAEIARRAAKGEIISF